MTTGAHVYQLVQDRVGRYVKPLPCSGPDKAGMDVAAAAAVAQQQHPQQQQQQQRQQQQQQQRQQQQQQQQQLGPMSTEDAMAGAPPPRGFCLRLVTGDGH